MVTTIFVVLLMAISGYVLLSREKALYLEDKKNQARVLIETAGVNFANLLLYQEVGLVEGRDDLDQYISDLLGNEKDILTLAIFNNKGMVIGHSNLSEQGKFYPDAKDIIETSGTVIKEVNNQERGAIQEAITPLMIGAKRIGTLRIEFSLKDFYERLAQLRKRIILVTLFLISGAILLIVIGFSAMIRPLKMLAREMDGVEYGRYEWNYEGKRRDEIGVLERSFFSMIRRLKEADIKWENTFNSITDLVSIHSKDYRTVKVNNALALRRHTTPDLLVGKYCWEVYHNTNKRCPNCPHAEALKTGKPSTKEKEYRPLRGIFLSSTFPYFNEGGKMIGTIHIAKDITEEKRLKKKIIQSEKLVAMGEMASGIAHQINNPLNSILAYSTYLLENLGGRDQNREELEKVVNAAIRCKEVVKRFLDFVREVPIRMEPIDIRGVIGEALSLSSHHVSFQKVKVIKEIDPDLYINADKCQVEEALANIILNAYDAMPAGGELIVKGAKEDSGIKIKISDTGCGIAEEDLDRIFDPFFTTKEPGKGTGLGLAVAYLIVKNHGGTINCESTEGKWTTFTIRLPQGKDI